MNEISLHTKFGLLSRFRMIDAHASVVAYLSKSMRDTEILVLKLGHTA